MSVFLSIVQLRQRERSIRAWTSTLKKGSTFQLLHEGGEGRLADVARTNALQMKVRTAIVHLRRRAKSEPDRLGKWRNQLDS